MTDTIFKEVGESAESMRGGKEEAAAPGAEGVIGEEIADEIPDDGTIDSDDAFSGSGSDDDYMANMKK